MMSCIYVLFDVFDVIVGEDSIWWWFDSSQDSIIPVQEDTTGTKLNKLPFLLNSNWTQLN